MIVDALTRAPQYFSGDWWTQAIAFALAAGADLPDGEQAILGRDVFAKLLSFTSGTPEQTVLESHRAYADIHVVLQGCETIRVWPADALSPLDAFDVDRDVVFYEKPAIAPVTLTLRPGTFALLLPQDAHMPTLTCGEPAPVKKLVVKISTALFPCFQGEQAMKGMA